MTEPTRLPNPMRRRAATERVVGWSWPPAPVLDAELCWCGRPVPASSACGDCCAEHDEEPDPNVCADCDHQRAFHFAEHDGLCFGLDCDCQTFKESA